MRPARCPPGLLAPKGAGLVRGDDEPVRGNLVEERVVANDIDPTPTRHAVRVRYERKALPRGSIARVGEEHGGATAVEGRECGRG